MSEDLDTDWLPAVPEAIQFNTLGNARLPIKSDT